MSAKFEAILFDLDGTLVDSAADLRRALNSTLAEQLRNSLDISEVKAMIGDGIAKLVERGFAATGPTPKADTLATLITRFSLHYDQNILAHTKLYPGVLEALRLLRVQGCRLGVCTNKPEAQAREILKGLNADLYFDVVTGGDSTDRRKPDPKPVLQALSQLGGTPETALFIGDSVNDAEAARRAGVASILVSYGYEQADLETLGAACIIDDFAHLPDIVGELAAA
ncbi:MAG: phosphoglycolate phosphatase [Rhodospirillaceae bacterium]|jgi:phosphoglycolate phosphatase|nr:phosphoglycolate phosphatase [Rhodospirillaceae bacterium]MBT4937839.1 phosphoglycolate phosphatase [Rhodospirillaceae bacterium]MBT5939735.1 phosphoglycolate phosphatase [Rhodospirillaceae bacterium]MBT7267269.1 phosphoglycolate phosphatase [Rhodospirillaceae bacterium]